ncbi:unnamed protein product [Periconia digitata]|uniref:Uncharacterized protein n=1 Tax=Periconia digitata TaxID=1303443 RepID=A0A9W4UEE8_9PLEO|nr:unnamed protein product [Periconia digitata]
MCRGRHYDLLVENGRGHNRGFFGSASLRNKVAQILVERSHVAHCLVRGREHSASGNEGCVHENLVVPLEGLETSNESAQLWFGVFEQPAFRGARHAWVLVRGDAHHRVVGLEGFQASFGSFPDLGCIFIWYVKNFVDSRGKIACAGAPVQLRVRGGESFDEQIEAENGSPGVEAIMG